MIDLAFQNLLILADTFLDDLSCHVLKMNSEVLEFPILRYFLHKLFDPAIKFFKNLFLQFFKLNGTDIFMLLAFFELFLFVFILTVD